jgi:hypothetical protein
MSVSIGGILSLSKRLIENIGERKRDRLVVLNDNNSKKDLIQSQRDDDVIFRFEAVLSIKLKVMFLRC